MFVERSTVIPFIEVHLANHDVSNIAGINAFNKRVENILQSTSGKVNVLFEDAYRQDLGDNDEEWMNLGVRPTTAVLLSKVPATKSKAEQYTRMSLSKVYARRAFGNQSSYADELIALDDLYLKYLDQQGQPRLRVFFEPFSSSDREDRMDKFVSKKRDIQHHLQAGDFESAVNLFMENAEWLAKDAELREKLVVKKITDKLDKEPFLVKFGTSHTGIVHLLREMGIAIQMVFPDKNGSTYLFDPESAVIRKVRFRGLKSVSEIEWYKAMLGDCFLTMLSNIVKKSDQKLTEHQMIGVAHQIASQIHTMKQIKEIEKNAKQDGILKPLYELLQN
jgi:hypothetical protein